MEQEKKSFPNYYPGQFLTSEDLNASFSYLEEQIRIMRADMSVGYGILKGLPLKRKEREGITVGSGIAVTSDGYHIAFIKPKTYRFMVKYDSKINNVISSNPPFLETEKNHSYLKDAYMLFETKEEIENMELNDVEIISLMTANGYNELKDYFGGLFVGFEEVRSVNCNQLTCDISNTQTTIVCKPVMLHKNNIQPAVVSFPKLKSIQIKQLANILENRDLKSIQDKINSTNKTNLNGLISKLDEVIKAVALCEEVQMQFVPFSFNERKALSVCYETIKSMLNDSIKLPYFYLFTEDLKKAVNEFISFYNYFFEKYRIFYLDPSPEQLILLEASFRTYHKPVFTDKQQVRDTKLLRQLLNRITAMINAFRGCNVLKQPVTITPCRIAATELGEESIPFYYYENDKGFKDLWHTVTNGIKNTFTTNKCIDAYNSFEYPFYKVEGCYGKKLTTVSNELNALIKKYSLPVKLQDYELNKIRHITKKDIANLKTIINTRKIKINKTNASIKNLDEDKKTAITKTLPSFLESLGTIIDSPDFTHTNNHMSFSSLSKMIKAKEILDCIVGDEESLFKYYNIQFKNNITNVIAIKRDKSIAALFKLHKNLNDIYVTVKNNASAEYRGGFCAHTIFMLLFYKNRVVMGINIPGDL